MDTVDRQYKALLSLVLREGINKTDRTNTGTLSVFGRTLVHDMSYGFPILSTKKIFWKGVKEELKWFLKGGTYAKDLSDKGVHIWDKDAERNGRDDTYLGLIYGYQWRKKSRYGVQKDQIKILLEGIRNNPDSRRHLVNAWDVMELDQMVLPPCHYAFQCYVRENKLDLMWQQRSADIFLGVPFNISSYGLLLSLLSEELDLIPGTLTGVFGDLHLYDNHIEQAQEQILRNYEGNNPYLKVNSSNILDGEFDVTLVDYDPLPPIKAPLNT